MDINEKVDEAQENELIDYAIVKEEYELNEASVTVAPVERISGNQEFVKFEITEINSNVDDRDKNSCFICEKTFRNPFRLKKHMFTHSNIRNFRCAHCAKAFKQKDYLKFHLKLHFKKPVKCDICNKTMKHLKGLKQHVQRKHTKRSPEKCQICGKEFSTKVYLQAHMKRMHEGERKPLICPICGKVYKFQHILDRHVEHHSSLKCNTCLRTFAKKKMLERHISIHDTAKPFVCEICNKSFRLMDYLNTHRKIHQTGANECVNCCYCSKTFGKITGLQSHMKQHHRGLPRNSGAIPQCTLCKEFFKTIEDLKKHVNKSHRMEKRFECAICCMKFKFKYLLRLHIEKVHLQNTELNQSNITSECPICFKQYIKRNLKIHIRTHNKNDRFSCNLCSKSYRTKYRLKKHKIFMHDKSNKSNKNKRIMCFYCNKTLRSKNALQNHMRTIHRGLPHRPADKPPFKCTICKFNHMTLDGLQEHVRKMHRIDLECALCGKKFIGKRFIERHLKHIHFNRNAKIMK